MCGRAFRSPASLVGQVLDTRERDPWAPDQLAWPLLRVIDEVVGEPWARVLGEHLGHGITDEEEGFLRRGPALRGGRRLAGLFASYALQRPQLLEDWEKGGPGDGAGGLLEPDLAWQPRLWRQLVAEVRAEPRGPARRGRARPALR